jgi:hypothetical protein
LSKGRLEPATFRFVARTSPLCRRLPPPAPPSRNHRKSLNNQAIAPIRHLPDLAGSRVLLPRKGKRRATALEDSLRHSVEQVMEERPDDPVRKSLVMLPHLLGREMQHEPSLVSTPHGTAGINRRRIAAAASNAVPWSAKGIGVSPDNRNRRSHSRSSRDCLRMRRKISRGQSELASACSPHGPLVSVKTRPSRPKSNQLECWTEEPVAPCCSTC